MDEPPELTLSACAAPECLERVHDLVAALWRRAPDVGMADRMAFEMAVAEIAANIVEHAGDGDRTVDLRLRLRAGPDHVEASFCDTGRAAEIDLASAELPDAMAESGRGLAMARAGADELAYERDGAVNRWRVVRRRRRDG